MRPTNIIGRGSASYYVADATTSLDLALLISSTMGDRNEDGAIDIYVELRLASIKIDARCSTN